jgi:hypothetical protein
MIQKEVFFRESVTKLKISFNSLMYGNCKKKLLTVFFLKCKLQNVTICKYATKLSPIL